MRKSILQLIVQRYPVGQEILLKNLWSYTVFARTSGDLRLRAFEFHQKFAWKLFVLGKASTQPV